MIMQPRYLCWMAALLLTGAARVAVAHDVLASGVSLWVRPGGMDLEVYLNRAAAVDLILPKGVQLILDEETFGKSKAKLLAVGPSLFDIAAGEGAGQAIVPERVQVGLTDENDVKFDI